jgi:Protein similar to CwfJ C-terminus 1
MQTALRMCCEVLMCPNHELDIITFICTQAEVRWGQTPDGRPHTWAHIQFADTSSVDDALALSGQMMLGRELTVSRANAPSKDGAGQMPLNLGKDVKDCWFCLSNEEADVHLVVDVLDSAYVALDKGPINDTHCLIVCIEHFPNTLTLRADMLADIDKLITALQQAYASRGLKLLGFERCASMHAWRDALHSHY